MSAGRRIGTDKNFAVAVHGGAVAVADRDFTDSEAHLSDLSSACGAELTGGAHALDVVEHAVATMEASGFYVAGRGSAPNTAGYVELDASIMAGDTKQAGAVASLRDIVHPVRVARGIMEMTDHVLLCGAGARAFAEARGFQPVEDAASYYTPQMGGEADEVQTHGTVGAVALDLQGRLAAATSTGGTFGKLEGRVGDTPLIGAGTWADHEVAISCTGVGEHIIRAGGAASIAFRLHAGVPLAAAIEEMLAEVRRLGGDGGVIAIRRNGEIVMAYNSAGMKRAAVGTGQPLISKTFA